MDNDIRIICTKCGAGLVPDRENKIYRCNYCGVAFGSSIIFDENAMAKANKALSDGEFNEADVWYRCVLMRCSYDLEALRGRILCAAKWKSFKDAEDVSAVTAVRLKNIRTKVDEAMVHAWDKDRGYLEKITVMLNILEKLWRKDLEIRPVANKKDRYERNRDFCTVDMPGVDEFSKNTAASTINGIKAELDVLTKERDDIEKQFKEVLTDLLKADSEVISAG